MARLLRRQIGHWSPSASQYDPPTRTLTAQISHLSWWAPWTWDRDTLKGGQDSTPSSGTRLKEDCSLNWSDPQGFWYVRATQCADGITSVSGDLSVHWPRLTGGTHSLAEIAVARFLEGWARLDTELDRGRVDGRPGAFPRQLSERPPSIHLSGSGPYPTPDWLQKAFPTLFPLPADFYTKCYDPTLCGFVQQSTKYKSGTPLSKQLLGDGPLSLAIVLQGDKWWIVVNGEQVGYFPTSIWAQMDRLTQQHGALVRRGGRIVAIGVPPLLAGLHTNGQRQVRYRP